MHVLRLAFAGIMALALCACQQTGTNGAVQASLPDLPPEFSTTVRTPSPDPGKWAYLKVNDKDQWRCRPLACADNSVVTIAITKSTTPRPDPVALDKYVKTEMPKNVEKYNATLPNSAGTIREVKLVSATVDKIHGYYAVRSTYEMTNDKGPFASVRAMIFASGSLVTIDSASMTLATAKTNLDDFTKALQIEGHPPE
jgi:hypothetical protein